MRTRTVVQAVLCLLVALLTVSACSNPPESGYVISKQYDDPDHWTTFEPVYTTVCQPTTRMQYDYSSKSYRPTSTVECHQQIMYWHNVPHYDGPHWRLRIRDDADPKHRAWVAVTEADFGRYELGGHWPDAR